jgi:hypothetical protein
MSETLEKSTHILRHEEGFAGAIAAVVIEKPQLSIWMILIPIIFVYHIYRFQKYSDGRKMFVKNYMISRKRALEEALVVVNTGNEPDIDRLVEMSTIPEVARQQYAEFMAVLIEHYADLLSSEGDNFDELVRSAYRNRTNYLLFLNRLNQTERALNKALKPHLEETLEGVNDIVRTIESRSEGLRRDTAERIFP